MSQSTAQKFEMVLPNRIIQVEENYFKSDFNHSSFMFSHNLADCPLFQLPRIVETAEEVLRTGNSSHFTFFYNNHVSAGSQYKEMQPRERVAEAISYIKESNSWLKLTSLHEVDSDYNFIINKFLLELEDILEFPLRQEITWISPTLFIASPQTVTPYHIDHECNFLLQIQGSKEVNLFNSSDRSVLTEQEIERYHIGDGEAVRYREENQSKANVYHLTPGKGVHHPVHAPHWVQNGNEISVALSIGFCTRALDLQARIYQANHYLRKLKLQPMPPGQSSAKDNLKIFFMGMLTKRNPKTRHEVMYSGIERIKRPAKFIQNLMK